ncbi:uncharacterized protein LOC141600695 [Silene latifolia]|uniref:uncharacterized protein LOC141600695 n=1 Tax=Silene latifolia TaxID=37657 RepID=UPI003D7809BB
MTGPDATNTVSGAPGKSNLHPVYSVTNILHKVRMLDGVKVNYSAWVKLFTLHARGYKVLHHIDGTKPPAQTDDKYESWCEIDAHVLQWIYGSVSDELLLRILEADSTAHEAWLHLKNHFHNNKGSRAAALEHEFTHMSLEKAASLDDYCQRLKDIATQLNDVGSAVDDQHLVLQMVRGLPSEYDVVGAYINQQLPSFENARGMLQLEEQRKSARTEAAPTALAAPAANDDTQGTDSHSHRGNSTWHNNNNKKSYHKGKGGKGNWKNNGKGGGNNSGGNNGSGKPPSAPATITVPVWPGTPWNAPWGVPPCPYPAQQGWAPAWQPQQPRGQSPYQPRYGPNPVYGQAFIAAPLAGYEMSNMNQAFQTMTLVPPDNAQWVMDTGASSHLTSESGTLNPPFNLSSIRSIFVGNGKSIPVLGSGHASITLPNRQLSLKNVLYAPNIIKNLISVRQFTKDNNVSVEFDPNGFSVKDIRTGRTIMRSNSTGTLYPVSATSSKEPPITVLAESSRDLWHPRLGHPGSNITSFLNRHQFIDCNKEPRSHLCHSCQVGKHKRLPFVDSNSMSLLPFDILHCDLWTSPLKEM